MNSLAPWQHSLAPRNEFLAKEAPHRGWHSLAGGALYKGPAKEHQGGAAIPANLGSMETCQGVLGTLAPMTSSPVPTVRCAALRLELAALRLRLALTVTSR